MNEFPPPLGSSDDAQWHYALDGERLGPVTSGAISRLITESKITRETKIWTKGFTEWKEAHLTEFGHHFAATPPALIGDSVSNMWVWVLAFVPLFFGIIRFSIAADFVAKRMAGNHVDAPNFNVILALNILINVILCFLDERSVKKAGHDTKKFKGWLWLVPVYLFVRAKHLKQNQAAFIVWLVLFILTLGA